MTVGTFHTCTEVENLPEIIALRQELDRLRGMATVREVVRLRAALQPFADAVFNDNGDMTISPCGLDAYRKAYFVMRGSPQTKKNF